MSTQLDLFSQFDRAARTILEPRESVRHVLTKLEFLSAWDEGQRRYDHDMATKAKPRNGAPTDPYKSRLFSIEGAVGEMVYASWGRMWHLLFHDSRPTRGEDLLGTGCDVKMRSRHHYDLLVQRDEKESQLFALVTIEGDVIKMRENGNVDGVEAYLHGWATLKQAKAAPIVQYEKGRPAHGVPQKELRSLAELERKWSSLRAENCVMIPGDTTLSIADGRRNWQAHRTTRDAWARVMESNGDAIVARRGRWLILVKKNLVLRPR